MIYGGEDVVDQYLFHIIDDGCLAEHFGRRRPLIVCSVIMALLLVWQVACAAQFVNPNYHNLNTGAAGIVAMMFFGFTFNSSFGPSERSPSLIARRIVDVCIQSPGYTRLKSSL